MTAIAAVVWLRAVQLVCTLKSEGPTAINQKDEGETETAVMRSKHGAAAPRVSIFLFVCVLNRKKRRGEIVLEDSKERMGGFRFCASVQLDPPILVLGSSVSLCRPSRLFSSWKFEPAPIPPIPLASLTFYYYYYYHTRSMRHVQKKRG